MQIKGDSFASQLSDHLALHERMIKIIDKIYTDNLLGKITMATAIEYELGKIQDTIQGLEYVN